MSNNGDRVIEAWGRSYEDGSTAFDAALRASGISFEALCDSIAHTLATGFLSGQLSFPDADAVANALWTRMTEESLDSGSTGLSTFAFAVYEAFDAGEYIHQEGSDPIQDHTIPLLRAALAEGPDS